jgi:KipI family sensor histidine kinase inhibitor
MSRRESGVLRDVRDGALLVEYPEFSDDEANRAAVSLAGRIRRAGGTGLLDAIPGARSLLLLFDPERMTRGRLVKTIDRLSRAFEARDSTRRLRIPVVYDGEDLAELARSRGLAAEELARRHAAASYRVAFVGFAPGFGYLSGLPPELAAARLASPRPLVPAGSVAIGGSWTGIYPSASPGGWRLIGRTSVRLFEPGGDPPSLLAPGDRVEFEAVRAEEIRSPAPVPTEPRMEGPPVFRVLSPGLFTSIQGAPLHGLGSAGVPPGGAMDLDSLALANRLAGNAPDDPALEITLAGPELEALEETVVAIAGGETAVEKSAVPAAFGEAFRLAPGGRLRLGRLTRGARAYLAVRGGIADPRRAGEPTRRLSAGELIAAGYRRSAARRTDRPALDMRAEVRVRAMAGPEASGFAPGEVERFFAAPWRVTAESDRKGLRLSGEPLAHAGSPEIPPSGTVPGSIQVPGNGLPIVLGPDGPVTGGYPRLATVIGADLPLIGQARPGAVLRFEAVSLAQAVAALRSPGSTITFP